MPAGRSVASSQWPVASRLPWLLTGGIVLFAWGALWNKLRIDWTVNEQYQYGWFVPPLAAALLAMRWPDRPAPRASALVPSAIMGLGVGALLFLLLPVRLIEQPNPDWRLLYWFHAGILTALCLGLALWYGGIPWLRHFAFPVLFLLVAIPWPSGPEQAIVQSLMRWVAGLAAGAMNLLGIPAVASGNLIRVRNEWVGVDEACSGIRSLQTTLMGGFLLGEVARLSWPRRGVLLGVGLSVALLANVLRSCSLVWIAAEHGASALERFHDTIGISVLVIVFGCLLWCNALLARGQRVPAASAPSAADKASSQGRAASRARVVPFWLLAGAGLWLVLVEVGTAGWYGSQEWGKAPARQEWSVVLPLPEPDFRAVPIDDRTRQLLRYDEGVSARWKTAAPQPADCTLFFFRWEPGHASIAQAEMHQPHICLTASGLTETSDDGIHPVALPDGLTLPVRGYSFTFHGRPIYVFYVVWRDGAGDQPLADTPGARWDRLRAVAERRPNTGRQTLEFIVGGHASPAEADAIFQRDIVRLVQRQG